MAAGVGIEALEDRLEGIGIRILSIEEYLTDVRLDLEKAVAQATLQFDDKIDSLRAQISDLHGTLRREVGTLWDTYEAVQETIDEERWAGVEDQALEDALQEPDVDEYLYVLEVAEQAKPKVAQAAERLREAKALLEQAQAEVEGRLWTNLYLAPEMEDLTYALDSIDLLEERFEEWVVDAYEFGYSTGTGLRQAEAMDQINHDLVEVLS